MQLYIVRHGIAIDREDPKCPPDPERYLTEEGVEKTKQVAKGVAALGVTGDLFLTSPYVRAVQTAEIFACFAAAFTINGTRRYSSKRCFPAARRAAVPTSSGRPGTRRTIASVDFSARNPAPLRTPHLRSARAKRKTPAKARTLFRCS